jgi:hypothetical protein
MERNDLTAFLVFGGQPLPDGRLLTRARFETLPTLAAAAAWAVAFFAYGLLRRHWRKEQLEVNLPEQPLAGTHALFKLALGLNAMFIVRLLLVRAGLVHAFPYLPVLGGVLELVMLYLFWSAVLGALRTRRSAIEAWQPPSAGVTEARAISASSRCRVEPMDELWLRLTSPCDMSLRRMPCERKRNGPPRWPFDRRGAVSDASAARCAWWATRPPRRARFR